LAQLDAGPAVVGVADHVDVGLGVEDHREAVAHQRLVVNDGDPDRHGVPASSRPPTGCPVAGPSVASLDTIGSTAHTPKPPPARGPAEKVPP
jgi:hypothetical protein